MQWRERSLTHTHSLTCFAGAGRDDGSWKLSMTDRDYSLAISKSGLECESRHPKAWNGARTVKGVHSEG